MPRGVGPKRKKIAEPRLIRYRRRRRGFWKRRQNQELRFSLSSYVGISCNSITLELRFNNRVRSAGWPADGQGGADVRHSKYHNFSLYEWVEEHARWDLAIIRRPEGKKGWVKLPIRWTVERTFAWLGRCRRLSKDREKSVLSSESFIKLAMIQLMLHRLEPDETDAEFHTEKRPDHTYGTDS